MTTLVKICGVMRPDDAARVAASGASFLGLNFWPPSKRYLAPERAPSVVDAARAAGPAQLVGVFVDPQLDEVLAIHAALRLDAIQLHGEESADFCAQLAAAAKVPIWKAIAVAAPGDVEHLETWPVDAIVLDAPTPGRGGAGAKFDHALAREARRRHPARKLVLAGGLDATSVAAAIALVQPWAVDVASGVEAQPGIKDPAKLAAFIAAVQSR